MDVKKTGQAGLFLIQRSNYLAAGVAAEAEADSEAATFLAFALCAFFIFFAGASTEAAVVADAATAGVEAVAEADGAAAKAEAANKEATRAAMILDILYSFDLLRVILMNLLQ